MLCEGVLAAVELPGCKDMGAVYLPHVGFFPPQWKKIFKNFRRKIQKLSKNEYFWIKTIFESLKHDCSKNIHPHVTHFFFFFGDNHRNSNTRNFKAIIKNQNPLHFSGQLSYLYNGTYIHPLLYSGHIQFCDPRRVNYSTHYVCRAHRFFFFH